MSNKKCSKALLKQFFKLTKYVKQVCPITLIELEMKLTKYCFKID